MTVKKKKIIHKSDLLKLAKSNNGSQDCSSDEKSRDTDVEANGRQMLSMLENDIEHYPMDSIEGFIRQMKCLLTGEEFRLFLVDLAYELENKNESIMSLLRNKSITVEMKDEQGEINADYSDFPTSVEELEKMNVSENIKVPDLKSSIGQSIKYFSDSHLDILCAEMNFSDCSLNFPLNRPYIAISDENDLEKLVRRRDDREIVLYCQLMLAKARIVALSSIILKLPLDDLDFFSSDEDE